MPSSDVRERVHPAAAVERELVEALRGLGLGAGVLVHVQVCTEELGHLRDGLSDAQLCTALAGALREVIGPDGTIVVPTYTFSFCRGESFDVDRSPTRWGLWNSYPAFPEFVRGLPGARRSADPIFSHAAVGPLAAPLLDGLPPACLGPGSYFDRLERAGGSLLLLGVGLHEATLRHSIEAERRVPWRYDKLFTGTVRSGGADARAGWVYNVRVRAPNGDPRPGALEAEAAAEGIVREAEVRGARCCLAAARDFANLARRALEADPWATAVGPAGDPVALEADRAGAGIPVPELPEGASMRAMIDGLWYLPRHIVSDGYDAALGALAGQLPMTIHEYPTGTAAWTWLVPEKWTCHEARLETLAGETLVSLEDHPLHVVSYSLPFEGEVSREELLPHLHVHPRLPGAIPWEFKYYERDWGLCLPQVLRDRLTEARYRVTIRSDFSYGTLKVGEVVAPGASEDAIVLCAHLCHPGMVNDDLTGVVVGMDVMRALLARPRRRYTYRFLIVPETIGSLAWLSANEHLIPSLRGGLFLEMLGCDAPHALQLSFAGDSLMDRCATGALARHDPAGWTSPFRTIIGNDERQFNAPGVRVPMLSLSRVLPPGHPEYPYREYHSSFDTPDLVTETRLEASRDLVLAMVDALEADDVPVNRFRGEVFCSRYGLHVDWYRDPAGNRAFFDLMYLVDGTRSVAQIAEACGIAVPDARRMLDQLAAHGLVEWQGGGS